MASNLHAQNFLLNVRDCEMFRSPPVAPPPPRAPMPLPPSPTLASRAVEFSACFSNPQAAFDDLREERYRVTPENGPRQAAAREWWQTTAAIERFLVLLPSLRSHFEEQELCDFPFDSEDEVRCDGASCNVFRIQEFGAAFWFWCSRRSVPPGLRS